MPKDLNIFSLKFWVKQKFFSKLVRKTSLDPNQSLSISFFLCRFVFCASWQSPCAVPRGESHIQPVWQINMSPMLWEMFITHGNVVHRAAYSTAELCFFFFLCNVCVKSSFYEVVKQTLWQPTNLTIFNAVWGII